MKDDRYRPMTKRLIRKLGEYGIVMHPSTTIHNANQVLCGAIVKGQKEMNEKKDQVRVLRLIEYVGPREWVESTLERSVKGTRHVGKGTIRAVTLGDYPEILENLPEDDRSKMEIGPRTQGEDIGV